MVFPFVVEPTRTDRHIALAAQPFLAILVPVHAIPVIAHGRFRIEEAPLRRASPSLFVADPADIGHRPAEYHRLRVFGLYLFAGLFIFIIGLRVDRARLAGTAIIAIAPIRTVEPIFEQRPVVANQLFHLRMELVHVARLAVVLAIAVPRRKVNTELQPIFMASIRKVAHHITLSILPRRILYGILRRSRRPEAEAVVVLGGQDDTLQSGRLNRTNPLFAIEVGRVECRSRRIAITPFQIIERIQSEMHERIRLQFMPFHLLGRRHRQNRCGSFCLLARSQTECGQACSRK